MECLLAAVGALAPLVEAEAPGSIATACWRRASSTRWWPRASSSRADVLEFPLVWTVRRLDRERLRGFEAAAVGNSLLWGAALALVVQLLRPRSRAAG